MKKQKFRAIAVTAIMGAIGFVLMALEFPIPFLIPGFIRFDFSELPAIITAFTFGPLYGILVCLIKNLLHLFLSSSAGVGEISNFILGSVFVGIAGAIYKHKKTRKSALIGTLLGALTMAVASIISNYFIVYPAYVVLYGMPMEAIVDMYKIILPAADSLIKALVIFNLPFTFIKGMADAAVCFAVYKRLSPVLKYGKKQRMLNEKTH